MRNPLIGAAFLPFLLTLLLASSPALVAQESFRATHYAFLSPDEETEFVDDFGAGIAIFEVNVAASTITWRTTVTGVNNITGAHIRRGPAGVDGPPIAPIPLSNATPTASGTISNVRATLLDSLMLGQTYINVYSSAWPNGQVRGQIVQIPNAGASELSSLQEPHVVLNDSATGSLVMWVDPVSRRAVYVVSWDALTGPATDAHFHLGDIGVAGPPVHTITIPASGATSAYGIWMMTPEQFEALLRLGIYVNIHTGMYTEGEIRGQVAPVDVFTAAISSANEVPTLAGQSEAAGTALVLVERLGDSGGDLGGYIDGSAIVEETTGAISSAHIHEGVAGSEGDPLVTMDEDIFTGGWFIQDLLIAEELELMRNSGTYMNFHTARFSDGEARGQLIPAATNLGVMPASAPLPSHGVAGVELSASYEPATDVIRIELPGMSAPSRNRLALYSPTGELLSETDIHGTTARFPALGLDSGSYFVRLTVDGRPAVAARVVVMR